MICSLVASVLQPDLVLLGAKDGKVKLINIDRGLQDHPVLLPRSHRTRRHRTSLKTRYSFPHEDYPIVVCWPCNEETLRVVNTENGRASTQPTKGFIEYGCGIGPKGFFLNGGRSLGMLSQARDRREVGIFKIDIN